MKPVKTATGEKKSEQIIAEPKSGNNLVLNIDADLQAKVYSALEKRLHDIGAKRGAAVAMNPQTGAVLALVSYPAYDDNLFSGGISYDNYKNLSEDPNQPLFNSNCRPYQLIPL